jgi:tRNA A-37 threonylcarbamoyl transferase component Bud32
VARLHRAGVLHGDLNGGNVLVTGQGEALFLDLRHSRFGEGAPPPGRRRRNFLRLARSLHKIRKTAGLVWPEGVWSALASGYAEGWGAREPWLEGWARRCEKGFPIRSLLWRRP